MALMQLLSVAAPGAVWADDAFRPLKIDGVPVRWMSDRSDQRVVLRYAFAEHDAVTPDAINCGLLRPARTLMARSAIELEAFRQAAAAAFSRWQQVAEIAFVEIADQDAADIVIGEQGVPQGFAFTNLTLAPDLGTPVRPISRATICLNPEKSWKIGYDGNLAVYDLVHTLAHEIGHAIGLDHPNARGQLMSFRYEEIHDGLSAGDIRGAVQIYGTADAAAGKRPPAEVAAGSAADATQLQSARLKLGIE